MERPKPQLILLECPHLECRYKPGSTGLAMEYQNYNVDKDYPCDTCGEPMMPKGENNKLRNDLAKLGIIPPIN